MASLSRKQGRSNCAGSEPGDGQGLLQKSISSVALGVDYEFHVGRTGMAKSQEPVVLLRSATAAGVTFA